MTKKQLKDYRAIRLERDSLARLIEEIEGGPMYSPKAQRLDGMPRSGSTQGSVVENAAIRHADLMSRYRQKEAELTNALVEIEAAIETLEPKERTLIRLHYAKGLIWEDVCVAMSYSWSQVHRIHSRALNKLKNVKETHHDL